MNFSNGGQNPREQANTNTRGPQFMNKDGFYPSTLVTGLWNELVSLKIHPALEKSQQTENKIFNYDKSVPTALTFEKTATLVQLLHTDVLPAVERNEQIFRAVQIGADAMIGVGSRIEGDRTLTYLAIYKGLHPETKRPEVSTFYEFRANTVIHDYNPDEGTFELNRSTQTELYAFTKFLESSLIGLSNATAHATRTVDRYFREKLTGTIDGIAEHVGAPTSRSGTSNYSRRSSGPDVFGGGGNSRPANPGRSGGSRDVPSEFKAPTDNMANIGDMNEFLQ